MGHRKTLLGRKNSMPVAQGLELHKSFRGLQIVKCSWIRDGVMWLESGPKDPMY